MIDCWTPWFLETTAVGKRAEVGERDKLDEWDIDRLDQEDEKEWVGVGEDG